MRAQEFIIEATPGEYVYHASTGAMRTLIPSLLRKGLQPSSVGYAGPGVYFAYTPEVAAGWSDDPVMLRVRWNDLAQRFGVYPKNENGIQRDDEEIIVPGVVPADLVEIEYFPGEWWDLESALSAETHHLDEVTMDGSKGAGAVPYNADVDYFGIRIKMKPKTWLGLALELNKDRETEERIKGLAQYIKDGGSIGQPWFTISIPPEWEDGDLSKDAKITGHEGRHRMEAILQVEGNIEVEVHLFPRGGLRARDIKPEWVKRLNQSIISERGQLVNGPWFTL